MATLNSYSVASTVPTKRRLSERLGVWYFHVLGVSALVALVAVFARQYRIDPDALVIAGIYLGIWPLVAASERFFQSPYKAFLLGGIILTATLDDVADAIRTIERAQSPSDKPQIIHLQTGSSYADEDWATLSVTSDFVILRRRSDGAVEVLPKSSIQSVTLGAAPVDS